MDLPTLNYEGPGRAIVQEMVAQIVRGLLTITPSRQPSGALVVQSRDEITNLPPGLVPELSDDPRDWLDFVENQRRYYMTPSDPAFSPDERWAIEKTLYDEPLGRFDRELEKSLTDLGCTQDDCDEATMLTTDCISARLFMQNPSPFWMKVYECLCCGLLPIAWSGAWPSGQLVAIPIGARSHR